MSAGHGEAHATGVAHAVAAARAAYCAANPLSSERFRTAGQYLPGGNTRTVLHFDPFPLGMDHAAGARLWDLDGHEYWPEKGRQASPGQTP